MFESTVYIRRRAALLASMQQAGQHGILIFAGNDDLPSQGSASSVFRFRQDSAWAYFFGVDRPLWAAILDIDSGEEKLYADDVDIDDIVWMGPQVPVSEMAAAAGIVSTAPAAKWYEDVRAAMARGRRVHFLPTMRDGNIQRIVRATGYPYDAVRTTASGEGAHASEELIKAVVALRLIKEDCEIEELDAVGELGFQMHELARKAIAPGVYEDEISAAMEHFAKKTGWGLSFETILSQHGETLHNCARHTPIAADRLVVVDAGVESTSHYASDHTRTYPATGKFTQKQRDIVQIVSDCNQLAFSLTRPGITYREVHIATVRLMLERLRDLGLVHGDVDEMQAAGIGGLFMPHGLGHNMGMDVHDMEEYGENYVGYDPDQTRAKQLGLGNLRMARVLRPGHVITDEPGIYFIPALIEQFKRDGIGLNFVNYKALEGYYDFGGVRIEDDVLVTPEGARLLGKRRLPASPDEVEQAMKH